MPGLPGQFVEALLYKVSFTFPDLHSARCTLGAVQDLLWPPSEAATLFEDGSGWKVEAYFQALPVMNALTDVLMDALMGTPEQAPGRPGAPRLPVPAVEAVPDANWVAISQAALPPVFAGGFVLCGSHDWSRLPHGRRTILIDAGEAFGTGHHATTAGCLMALGRLAGRRRFARVLDLGTGAGTLAIAAARVFPDAVVLASDADPAAVEVARQNIRRNGAARRVTAVCAAGLAHPRLRAGRFSLVLANILAGPLIRLAPGLVRALVPGGCLVLSGILTREAWAVSAAYRTAGFAVMEHRRLAGWSTLTLIQSASRASVR